ncbi:M64 family metallopeptidase [Algoriphagus litoralis]|uniref:M64 family metallopeptidase n=1 Tax=Algoriphagus litoralis TaxID=2202829 RepID=UPI000DB9D2D3|nr:M64 family metallopeptidase [Algoriphagus litoralis]
MIKHILNFGLVLFFVSIKGYSQVFPLEVVKYKASPDLVVNLVILGDGYTADQQDKFLEDVNRNVEGMLELEPWRSHKDKINVYAVKVISNKSGASDRPSEPVDNYFGSSFYTADIERLLYPTQLSKVYSVLNSNTPFFDLVVIMVNDSRYGGAGGEFATFSTHPEALQLMVHEIGHTFSGLADEYWAGDQYADEKANMTQNNNPGTVRWKSFLNIASVGIFPHEESPKWYRPHQNCLMRFLGSPLCEVCKNEVILTIDNLTEVEPFESPIAFFGADKFEIYENQKVTFFDLTTQSPETWEWSFEGGSPASSEEQNPVISFSEEGLYTVSLTSTNAISSNTYSRNQFIRVRKDDLPPTLRVKNVEVELDSEGNAQLTVSQVDNGTFDNVELRELFLAKTNFDCNDLGVNHVIFKAVDINGNSDSTLVAVTVKDRIAPIAKVKNIALALGEEGDITISPQDIDDGSFDNCGIVSMSLSKETFDIRNQGDNWVDLILTDSSGNRTVATAIVNIDILLSSPNKESMEVLLYPNPSSGKVQIVYPKNIDPGLVQIDIIDSRGVVLNQIYEFQKVGDNIYFELNGLSNGIYFVKLYSRSEIKMLKLILRK